MEEITINLDPGPFLEDLALLETAPELVERFVSAIDAGDVLGAVDPDPVSTDAGHYLYRLEPVGLITSGCFWYAKYIIAKCLVWRPSKLKLVAGPSCAAITAVCRK